MGLKAVFRSASNGCGRPAFPSFRVSAFLIGPRQSSALPLPGLAASASGPEFSPLQVLPRGARRLFLCYLRVPSLCHLPPWARDREVHLAAPGLMRAKWRKKRMRRLKRKRRKMRQRSK